MIDLKRLSASSGVLQVGKFEKNFIVASYGFKPFALNVWIIEDPPAKKPNLKPKKG